MSERKPLLSDDEIRKLVDRWIATSVQNENETRMVQVAVCDPPYPASLVRDHYENLITTGKLRVVEDPKDTHFKTQQKSLEVLRDGGKQFELYIGDMMHLKLFDKDGLEHPIFSFHAGFPVHEMRVVEEVELIWGVDERGIGCHYCSSCGRRHPAQIGNLPNYYCPGCGNLIKR